MAKITITIDEDNIDKVHDLIDVINQTIKPTPDSRGKCRCVNPEWVEYWYSDDYCKKCGGSYY